MRSYKPYCASGGPSWTCWGVTSPSWRLSRKPFPRITYERAVEILRGTEVRQMLEADLTTATARVDELNRMIKKKEAEHAGDGIKQWKVEKLAREIMEHREELAEQETSVRNIPHHMDLAANFEWGTDLGGSDETIIARMYDRPVCVTHYPCAIKGVLHEAQRRRSARGQRSGHIGARRVRRNRRRLAARRRLGRVARTNER